MNRIDSSSPSASCSRCRRPAQPRRAESRHSSRPTSPPPTCRRSSRRATGGGDRQMKVVDMGKYNVSVGVLRRGPRRSRARRWARSTTST